MQLTRMFPSILKKVPQTKTIYATIDQVYMWFYWTNIYKNLVCLTDVRFSFLKGGMAGALPRVTDGQKRDGDNREWKHQSDKYNCWMTLHHALFTPSKSVVALWHIFSSFMPIPSAGRSAPVLNFDRFSSPLAAGCFNFLPSAGTKWKFKRIRRLN